MGQILTAEELRKKLKMKQSTFHKSWRNFPCFSVTGADTLKSMRFDYEDVINHIKTEGYNQKSSNQGHFDTKYDNSNSRPDDDIPF